MKKILSVILAIAMLFAVTSVAAGAAETIIEPLKRITVTASAENSYVLKFVPEETKTYIVTSYAPDDIDPYCDIESEVETYHLDDTDGLYNFAGEYEFEAGVEYYFTIYTYSDEDVTFDIALECAHDWEDGVCIDCGIVCDHETKGTKFGSCMCGEVSDVTEIRLGETIADKFVGIEPIFVKFTPEEDVAAIFYSNASTEESVWDVHAIVYDANGNWLTSNDDIGDSLNFAIWYEFKAGETYLFEIQTFYENAALEFSLVKAVHTVDGEEHAVVFSEYEHGTCQTLNYREGFYCAECDEYLAGHTEDGYGYCIDEDLDDICDYCGESMNTDTEDNEDNEDNENDGNDDTTEENFFGKIRNFLVQIFAYFLKILKLFI